MDRHVTMSFLEAVVLFNIVEIVTTDHDSPLHFHLLDDSSENSSSDRNIPSEGAFLVNVSSFNCLITES